MIKLIQTHKNFRVLVEQGNASIYKVFCSHIDYEIDSKIQRVYLGFKCEPKDLRHMRYYPNEMWSKYLIALSNNVYYDDECEECFITLYVDTVNIADYNYVGEIIVDTDCEIEYSTDYYKVVPKIFNCSDVKTYIEYADNTFYKAESKRLLEDMNNITSRYGYSWYSTIFTLIRQRYITVDEQGNIAEENKWLFDNVKGFRENYVEQLLCDFYKGGGEL